jgi:5-methylcytosine-specific restriction endonuclease McrA
MKRTGTEWAEDVSPAALFDAAYVGEFDDTETPWFGGNAPRSRKSKDKSLWSAEARVKAELRRCPGDLNLTEWKKIVGACRERCIYCGEMGSEETLTIDHVVPVSRGGRTDVNNVLPACHPCNTLKRDRSLQEWFNDEMWRKFLDALVPAQRVYDGSEP